MQSLPILSFTKSSPPIHSQPLHIAPHILNIRHYKGTHIITTVVIPEDDDEQQVTNDLESDVQQVHVLDGKNGNQNLADDLGSDDLKGPTRAGL